jgi:hypothetical protein
LGFGSFSGKVPTPRGDISVSVGEGSVCVLSEIDGGTLLLGGKEYHIEKGKELCVEI